MASLATQTDKTIQGHLLHVGFMVPIKELAIENDVLQNELGRLNFRSNIYSAVLFHKGSNQDTMKSWYDQRKRTSRTGYLRAYYMKKNGDSIIEMDVDGKQFYLITSMKTSEPPLEMKRDIARGLFGERKPFAERIEVPCFPYKYDANAGFIECDAFICFKKEQEEKKQFLNSTMNIVSTQTQ